MSRLFLCRAMDPFRGPFGDYVRASSREAARARFFGVPAHNDEQGRDGTRVYIRQHPAEAGLYSFSELWKEGRVLTSEELDQIEGRVRRVAKTLLWHDCVPLDDLSDMGTLCVWDVPRLMGMVSVLTEQANKETAGAQEGLEGQI